MLKELDIIMDYRIELDTLHNEYIVSQLEENTTTYNKLKVFNNYEQAKEYINNRHQRLLRGEIKKKKPLFALKKNSYARNKLDKVKITSINKESVWVVYETDNRRSKEWRVDGLIKDTPENLEKLKKIEEIEKQLEELENSVEEYTQSELKEYFKEDE